MRSLLDQEKLPDKEYYMNESKNDSIRLLRLPLKT